MKLSNSSKLCWTDFCCCCLIFKPCPSLCKPNVCSLQGPSVHGIYQARILEWFAIPFSRRSSRSRYSTWVPSIGRWILYCWVTREAPMLGWWKMILLTAKMWEWWYPPLKPSISFGFPLSIFNIVIHIQVPILPAPPPYTSRHLFNVDIAFLSFKHSLIMLLRTSVTKLN